MRPAIQSPNYVAGTSGWTINADGTAEFNSVVIRGNIQIGSPTGSEITTTFGGVPPQTSLNFFTHNTGTPDQTETSSGTVSAQVVSNQPTLILQANGTDNGNTFMAMQSPTLSTLGKWQVGGAGATPFATGLTMAALFDADVQVQVLNPNPVTGACGLLVGAAGANNRLFIGPNQLQGTNNAAVADLSMQPAGGRVIIPGSTTWTTTPLLLGAAAGAGVLAHPFGMDAGFNGTLNQPLYLNNNSTQGIRSFRMQSAGNRNTGSATVTATTFTAVLDCPVTVTLPPSGALLISHAAIITYPGSSKDFYQDFYIVNVTQGNVQVYGPSTNNGIYFNGGATVIPTTGGLRLAMTSVAANALGNSGDQVTVGLAQMTSASGSIPISRVWLSVTPSL